MMMMMMMMINLFIFKIRFLWIEPVMLLSPLTPLVTRSGRRSSFLEPPPHGDDDDDDLFIYLFIHYLDRACTPSFSFNTTDDAKWPPLVFSRASPS